MPAWPTFSTNVFNGGEVKKTTNAVLVGMGLITVASSLYKITKPDPWNYPRKIKE